MALSETLRQAIPLAEAVRDYWDEELPKRHPRYPIVGPGEDSGPPPPEERELDALLSGLPDEDIYKALLVTYIGRGEFGTAGLADEYEALKSSFGESERAAPQMILKDALADWLSDGLAELARRGIDIDHLPLASARPVKH